MFDWTPGRCAECGDREGSCLPIYEKDAGDVYSLGRLWAFSDGSLHYALQPGTLVATLAQLEAETAIGRIVPFPPSGARVVWGTRAAFTVTDVDSRVDGESLVSEVRDAQRIMRGEPSALVACRKAIASYVRGPTGSALSELRAAYTAVARHQRPFLISMDAKDHPVRALLAADSPSETQRLTKLLADEIAYAWPNGEP